MPSPPHTTLANRFLVLDGIRGLAAISVMVYHFSSNSDLRLMPLSWVAVDLFFALSGFVLAHGFEQKIREGMSFGRFLKARLIRLYPLYFLGLSAGFIGVLLQVDSNQPTVELSSIAKAYALNLVGLPYFNQDTWRFMGADSKGMCFPLNGPAWTLSLEMMVNVVFYFWARYFKPATLKWMVPVFFLILAIGSYAAGTIEGGWAARNYPTGLYRVFFQFFLGVFLYHALKASPRIPSKLAYPLIALLFFLFYWGTFKFMILAMFIVSPLVICAGARKIPGPRIEALSKFLGDVSYPIYILHAPISVFLFMSPAAALPNWGQLAIASAVSLAVAWQFIDADAQFRTWLVRKLA